MSRYIEGNLDDIIAWMNDNPRNGHLYIHAHSGLFNVGLFSINEDHMDFCSCQDNLDKEYSFSCKFERTTVYDSGVDDLEWEISDPDNTHLIRF